MKIIKDIIYKSCVVCGKKIKVILYADRTYKGGHFFGKLTLLNNKKAEYWECEECYKGSDKD